MLVGDGRQQVAPVAPLLTAGAAIDSRPFLGPTATVARTAPAKKREGHREGPLLLDGECAAGVVYTTTAESPTGHNNNNNNNNNNEL